MEKEEKTVKKAPAKKPASKSVPKTAAKSAPKAKPAAQEPPKTVADTMKKNMAEEIEEYTSEKLIPCSSYFPGTLILNGSKSGNKYVWDNIGDIALVEYRDLKPMLINKKSSYVYGPLLIIQDENICEKYPELNKIYSTAYSVEYITNLLTMKSAANVEKIVTAMPESVKNVTKTLAATLIDEGVLDRGNIVTVLDGIFGTCLREKLYTM